MEPELMEMLSEWKAKRERDRIIDSTRKNQKEKFIEAMRSEYRANERLIELKKEACAHMNTEDLFDMMERQIKNSEPATVSTYIGEKVLTICQICHKTWDSEGIDFPLVNKRNLVGRIDA